MIDYDDDGHDGDDGDDGDDDEIQKRCNILSK